MGDRQNQNQNRAHKQNLGILQAHEANLMQMQKDRRKRIHTVDQEIIEAYKFLEQIKTSSGNSVKYEDIYGDEARNNRKLSLLEQPTEAHKPSRGSLMRMEVKLRKALTEASFKTKSTEFFRKWEKTFKLDLDLAAWEDEPGDDAKIADWMRLPTSVSKSFMAEPYKKP